MRKGLSEWEAAKAPNFTDAEFEEERDLSNTDAFLVHRMRLELRKQEKEVINRLQNQSDELIRTTYGDIDKFIERYYGLIESVGYDITRIDQLELERLILSIQKTVYTASDVVSQLYNDAYIADRIQQDEYWDAYKEPATGTKDDRQAFAYGKTRDSRFYYYYRYMTWKALFEKLNALRELQKTLEFHRSRIQRDRF